MKVGGMKPNEITPHHFHPAFRGLRVRCVCVCACVYVFGWLGLMGLLLNPRRIRADDRVRLSRRRPDKHVGISSCRV